MIILRLFKILRHPDTSLKSILNMAAAYVLIRNRQLIRRERVFRDIINPLDYMDDCDILEKFRLPRHVIFDLCNELNDRLEHPTKRSHALPTSLQVMVALRFYASGSFQAVCADLHGISKASVSRIVYAVTSALVALSPVYIKFPSTDRNINNTILDFAHICNFPNVIGGIDGTHIPIRAPSTQILFCVKCLRMATLTEVV